MKCFFTYLEKIYIFVKDKTNILPHNIWTCGDYSQNIDNLPINKNNITTFSSFSKAFSSNGEYSIKLTRTEQATYWFTALYNYTVNSEDLNKTITFTADVKNELTGTASIQLQPTNGTLISVNIPAGESTITVSTTLTNTTGRAILGFPGIVTGDLYVDNLRLTIQ